MNTDFIKGVIVPIITVIDEEEKINEAAMRAQVDYVINGGLHGILAFGSNGEFYQIEEEEMERGFKIMVDQAAGRVPVYFGIGAINTKKCVRLAKMAVANGAAGISILQPMFLKPNFNELFLHFKTIAEAVPETPIIMYNVPSRTGCNIQPATAVALAKNVKNIVGIKAASGDLSQIATMMSMADGCIQLYSGNDDQVLPILSLGGLGVISVLSNVAPKETHDMVMKFLEGDTKGAAEIQLKAIPLIHALFSEVNPIPVKAALNLMGKEVGPLRMPLSEMEDANKAKLAEELKNFGIKLA